MLLAVLALLAAPVERAWTVDEALVTVESGPRTARLSAVSVALAGTFREQPGGLAIHLKVPAASLATGNPERDAKLRAQIGDVVFEGVAENGKDGHALLKGTLTYGGAEHEAIIPATFSHVGTLLWLHAVYLGDARIDVDAGLRPAGATVASR